MIAIIWMLVVVAGCVTLVAMLTIGIIVIMEALAELHSDDNMKEDKEKRDGERSEDDPDNRDVQILQADSGDISTGRCDSTSTR